mmetsp:Transcript_36817/g.56557  ORF Transcript_36817/g.56557 Transcript_36817/m.56557 type:complete len:163 (-) Transcript_36817:116-604(-)
MGFVICMIRGEVHKFFSQHNRLHPHNEHIGEWTIAIYLQFLVFLYNETCSMDEQYCRISGRSGRIKEGGNNRGSITRSKSNRAKDTKTAWSAEKDTSKPSVVEEEVLEWQKRKFLRKKRERESSHKSSRSRGDTIIIRQLSILYQTRERKGKCYNKRKNDSH